MRIHSTFYFVCALLLTAKSIHSQRVSDKSIGKISSDIRLTDTAGNKVKLSDYKGKVIYLDFWVPSCGPCLKLAPYEDSLIHRLAALSLDTSILLIKVCNDCNVDEWKVIVKQKNSRAINLLFTGGPFALNRRFDASPYPAYHIIGRDFRYLGIRVARPDDENIDHYLRMAIQNVSYPQTVTDLSKSE